MSRIECGHADETTLAALDAVARALSARLDVGLSWNGEALDRLLDADHAAIVELVARELRALGWDVAVEVTFSIRGERGSVDILAFHPARRVILVVEVKSVVPDLQAMVFTLDRKSRLAVEIGRPRGWQAVAVGRILVVADGRTSRRRVAAHQATFAAAFPARGVAVRRWLRSPDAGTPVLRPLVSGRCTPTERTSTNRTDSTLAPSVNRPVARPRNRQMLPRWSM